jgi:hypothetical protein
MEEKEILIKFMYEKHQKLILPLKLAAKEWGSSSSRVSKLFGGEDSLPEDVILRKRIIPKWIFIGKRRFWKITDIAEWICETEKITKVNQ